MAQSKKEALVACLHAISQAQLAYRHFLQQGLKESNVDLTFEMLQVLKVLWENDGSNQQQLADATLKDKTSITYLLNNLEKRELVTRAEDATDRRNKQIHLTKAGKKLAQQLQPLLESAIQVAGKEVTVAALTSCTDALARMSHSLAESGRQQ